MSLSDLIRDWVAGHPTRNAAALARSAGVSRSEISYLIRGRLPGVEVAMKLMKVLPALEVARAIGKADPGLGSFLEIVCQAETLEFRILCSQREHKMQAVAQMF